MVGAFIGAVFGAAFVVVNAHAPLPEPFGVILSILAILAVCAIAAMSVVIRRRDQRETPPEPASGASMFGRGYRWVVLAEVVALVGGIAVLRLLRAPEEANVAWIALVVGVHFIALAPVWKRVSIGVVGGILAVAGVAGLVMTATPAVAWVPIVSGVASGVTLLASSTWAVARVASSAGASS
jgi:Na+-transporting methylmalonyl-CoA/oxaloacetate decarboxylase gamma subunit